LLLQRSFYQTAPICTCAKLPQFTLSPSLLLNQSYARPYCGDVESRATNPDLNFNGCTRNSFVSHRERLSDCVQVKSLFSRFIPCACHVVWHPWRVMVTSLSVSQGLTHTQSWCSIEFNFNRFFSVCSLF
jgi:hypothetical protein